MVEYHSTTNDSFGTEECEERKFFYGNTATPSSIFDGIKKIYASGDSTYVRFRRAFDARKVIGSPLEILLQGSYAGGSGEIIATINQTTAIPDEWNLNLRYIITESEIPYTWFSEDSLHFVVRDMLPDENGVSIDFAGQPTFVDTQQFVIDPLWKEEHCDLVVFVQWDNKFDILQTKKKTVLSLGINENVQQTEKVGKFRLVGPTLAASQVFRVTILSESAQRMIIDLYDISGRKALQLFDGKVSQGRTDFNCETSGLPSGVYFVRGVGEEDSAIMKFTIVK